MIDRERVRAVIEDVLRPGNFYVRPDLPLFWKAFHDEEISWEIFRGRLLDPAHTRQRKRFLSLSVCQTDGSEPLLSVKLDEQASQIHVVRAILSFAWEGYDAGNNVIESRETTKWVRELVGTVDLSECADPHDLRAELGDLLTAAVKGTSRLPLTSVEAPLPAFTLGQLAYVGPGPQIQQGVHLACRTDWGALLNVPDLSLEMLLRTISPDQAVTAARRLAATFSAPALAREFQSRFRQLFRDVSLTPYTSFVDTTLAVVKVLVDQQAIAAADEIDLWSWLVRQLGRHLTAYDLFTFHHRGANYPDALLLDAVLKRYVRLIESYPDLFVGDGPARLRRRALRQACLVRRHYEGHPVPDAPTSPGENARVLPAPHERVPVEQLLNVLRRKKRLYEGEPLAAVLGVKARQALHAGILDVSHEAEWRELGMANFIDRPFGWGKAVGEPDQTPLLVHEAFSPSIARRRAAELRRLAGELDLPEVNWDDMPIDDKSAGLPIAEVAEPDRPVASLADARRVADDFLALRTFGHRKLFASTSGLDFSGLEERLRFQEWPRALIVRIKQGPDANVLAIFDAVYRKRAELIEDLSQGFVRARGTELPKAGFRVRGENLPEGGRVPTILSPR